MLSEPFVSLAFREEGESAGYEWRVAVRGGVRIMRHATVWELAHAIFTPEDNPIEIGGQTYNRNLVVPIRRADGFLRHWHDGEIVTDGVARTRSAKVDYIADLAERLGVRRAVFYAHKKELLELADEMGLTSRESYEIYKKFGVKSGLNNALFEYKQGHPDATIGPFGVNFHSIEDIETEVARLRMYGVDAIVKFDRLGKMEVLSGGVGQIIIPCDVPLNEVRIMIERVLDTYEHEERPISGVTQMFVPVNRVISVTTEVIDGVPYMKETHVQTQESLPNGGFDSNGSIPLKNIWYINELLKVYEQVKDIYIKNGFTGGQNMNLLVLPPKYLALARAIYDNQNMSSLVCIDSNPREISGAYIAMLRFHQETEREINWYEFADQRIHMHPWYAANIHIVHLIAQEMFNLHAGPGGNFSITNLGKITMEALQGGYDIYCKMFAQDTTNSLKTLKRLEEVLLRPPSEILLKYLSNIGIKYFSINDVLQMNDVEYRQFLVKNINYIVFERLGRRKRVIHQHE